MRSRGPELCLPLPGALWAFRRGWGFLGRAGEGLVWWLPGEGGLEDKSPGHWAVEVRSGSVCGSEFHGLSGRKTPAGGGGRLSSGACGTAHASWTASTQGLGT